MSAEEVAAVLDGEKLSSRRYRRERWFTVAAAVVATLIVGAILSHVIGGVIASNARHNSTELCEVQKDARIAGNRRAFVQVQILEVADRAFARFPRRFQELENKRIAGELRARHYYLGSTAPLQVRGFSDLGKLLAFSKPIDCDAVVR